MLEEKKKKRVRKAKIMKTYRFSTETLTQMEAIKNYLEQRDHTMYHNTAVLETLISDKYEEIINK